MQDLTSMEAKLTPINVGVRFVRKSNHRVPIFYTVRNVSTLTLPEVSDTFPIQETNPIPKEAQENPITTKTRPNHLRTAAIVGGVALGTAAAAVVAAPFAIAGLGFGAAGVAAGSLAAAWQSSLGLVAAGSLFAGLQSAGAAGLALGAQVAVAGAGAAFGAGAAGVGAAAAAARRRRPDEKQATNLDVTEEEEDEYVQYGENTRTIGTNTKHK